MDTFVILKYFVDFAREEFAARIRIWGFHLAKRGDCTAHFSCPFFLRRSEWHTNCPACCATEMHSPFAIGLAGRLSDLILNYGFWFISHSQSVMDLCRPIRSLRVSISLIAKKRAQKKNAGHLPDGTLPRKLNFAQFLAKSAKLLPWVWTKCKYYTAH